ncbi:hypothetical protein Trco_007265 [Trichoderma cornu-damae]|uniref:Uncharacterized protein n=1 Tax=Trichoderma cornu-damae TaxID=654480 RepID=A0A9P8TU74_9HYPO|nr:hypothetical protein Trco_007265 [Trichoderma cornu-damae]
MCKEYLTIAVCAPQEAPRMSFTCAKLHLVAEKRELCDKATGECLCFFGTCGIIQEVSPSEGILISSLKPIRCAACTSLEEEIGDRRSKEELICSPLLGRTAIQSPEQMEKFAAVLGKMWDGKKQCPFHITTAAEEEVAGEANELTSSVYVDTTSEPPVVSSSDEKSEGNAPDESKRSSSEPEPSKPVSRLGRKAGIESSIWANVKEESPRCNSQSPCRFQTGQNPARRGSSRSSSTVMPIMEAAKSFLGDASAWQ